MKSAASTLWATNTLQKGMPSTNSCEIGSKLHHALVGHVTLKNQYTKTSMSNSGTKVGTRNRAGQFRSYTQLLDKGRTLSFKMLEGTPGGCSVGCLTLGVQPRFPSRVGPRDVSWTSGSRNSSVCAVRAWALSVFPPPLLVGLGC